MVLSRRLPGHCRRWRLPENLSGNRRQRPGGSGGGGGGRRVELVEVGGAWRRLEGVRIGGSVSAENDVVEEVRGVIMRSDDGSVDGEDLSVGEV